MRVISALRFSDSPGRIVSTVVLQVLQKILVFVHSKQNLNVLRGGLGRFGLVPPILPLAPEQPTELSHITDTRIGWSP